MLKIDDVAGVTDPMTQKICELFELPLLDLVFQAQQRHRDHFPPNEVQLSALLSIKTGGCAENCGYCSQSGHHKTGLKASKLMPLDAVSGAARRAQASGAQRFCMGAAWRSPKERDMDALCTMVREVKSLGLETCMTLGMLDADQALRLREAGLDYYNHNLDSSPEFYDRVVTTRSYEDRLETLRTVRAAGISVCAGGILGMGESREDRIRLLSALASLDPAPESVPINVLVPIEGTPIGDAVRQQQSAAIDPLEVVRTIAAARIALPTTVLRLSAGRETMSDELQGLCFLAGANSIFCGDQLLTTSNNGTSRDRELFDKLGLRPAQQYVVPLRSDADGLCCA